MPTWCKPKDSYLYPTWQPLLSLSPPTCAANDLRCWSTLKHTFQHVQGLSLANFPPWERFCRWFMQQAITIMRFLSSVLFTDIQTLQQHVHVAFDAIWTQPGTFKQVRQSMMQHVHACTAFHVGHFGHLLWHEWDSGHVPGLFVWWCSAVPSIMETMHLRTQGDMNIYAPFPVCNHSLKFVGGLKTYLVYWNGSEFELQGPYWKSWATHCKKFKFQQFNETTAGL